MVVRLAEPANARPAQEGRRTGLVGEPAIGGLTHGQIGVATGAVGAAVEDQLLPAVDGVEVLSPADGFLRGLPRRLTARPPRALDAVLDDVLDHVERALEDVADQRRDGPPAAERLALERVLELLGD